MLTHIARLWLINDFYCFLWSLFAKRNRSWKRGVSIYWSWKSNSYGLLIWKVLSYTPRSVRKEALNKCSYLGFLQYWLWFLTDLRFAHFWMIRISAFPVFLFSGLSFPVSVSTYIRPCRAGWMEGLFEVVVVKSQFSDPKWNLLNRFSDSRANSHLWKVVLPSY